MIGKIVDETMTNSTAYSNEQRHKIAGWNLFYPSGVYDFAEGVAALILIRSKK